LIYKGLEGVSRVVFESGVFVYSWHFLPIFSKKVR